MDTLSETESIPWDAVVIGTGIGGATVGYELAKAGHRVLFVERGRDLRCDDGAVIAGRHIEDAPEFGRLREEERREWLARGGRSADTLIDHSSGRPSEFVPYV